MIHTPNNPKNPINVPEGDHDSPLSSLVDAKKEPRHNSPYFPELIGLGLKGKKRRFATAMLKTNGIVTLAEKVCGVSRRNHSEWMKKDPKYAEAIELAHNKRLDMALSLVMERIAVGEGEALKAAMFVLENEGQKLGYGNRGNTNVQVNTAIQNNGPIWELKALIKKEEARLNQESTESQNVTDINP